MRRDTLELADDSLFIETSDHAFSVVEAHLPASSSSFSKEAAPGFDSTPLQAASLLPDSDTDATTIAVAALIPLIWKDHADPGDVRKHFGRR